MATDTRDAIVAFAAKNEGKFFTADDLAEKLKLNRGSALGAMYQLSQRAVLVRRVKEGSREVEYAAGKRLAFGQKYAGRKFPFHRKEQSNGEAIPASSGAVGIIIKVDGQAHAITLSDAKAIYLELKVLFG